MPAQPAVGPGGPGDADVLKDVRKRHAGGLQLLALCFRVAARQLGDSRAAGADDWERRREAGVPESVGFRTKPQLARLMLERAVESGVPFAWVAGDEVYGNDRNLRLWLERRCVPHVLAIKRSEKLWALTDKGPRQVRADRLASGVEECAWVRGSAGDGAKGPRIYDWATVDIRPLREPGQGYWLCWSGAVWPTPGNWPTTSVTARRERPWRNWRGWPGPGGP